MIMHCTCSICSAIIFVATQHEFLLAQNYYMLIRITNRIYNFFIKFKIYSKILPLRFKSIIFILMDLNKLKKRPSYPFETIAVAVSFSPRCLPVLAEAKRLSDLLGASLVLIHIGIKTSNKEQKLDELMNQVGIDARKSRVIWMEGDPVETILKLCKLNIVDLLIIGALVKEN